MKQEDVYLYLRERITDFSLVPGEVISENSLSLELNVSRSPIRDALAQLEEEGWVVVYPQRGTQVSFLSIGRINEFCFIKKLWDYAVFEILCSQNLEPSKKETLQNLLVQQRKFLLKGNCKAVLSCHLEVERQIYAYAGHEQAWNLLNKFSCDILRIYFLQMQAAGEHMHMTVADSWDNTIIEYQSLVTCLWRSDIATAYMINKRNIEQLAWNGDSFKQLYPHYYEA